MDTLEAVVKHFNANILPVCRHFIFDPPADLAERDQQRTQLTGVIVRQVLFQLHEVVADGDEVIKKTRQSLVEQVQNVLWDLDHGEDTRAWLFRGLKMPAESGGN